MSTEVVILSSPINPHVQRSSLMQIEALGRALPATANGYSATEVVIENMKIEAPSNPKKFGVLRRAIAIKGAANVIRNSTIEINNGHAAIYLFGPGQIIENNTIILKGRAIAPSAAAIKLHHGDGSIIRNNEIIVMSGPDDAPISAISLVETKDAIIENNRVRGVKMLVKNWDDNSTYLEKDNELRRKHVSPIDME